MPNKLETVALNKIIRQGQVRAYYDETALHELAQSMGAVGLLHPILVEQQTAGFLLKDGHRRLLAAEKLGWKEISALISDKVLSKAETIHAQMICNCQHLDLQPLERAKALADLMEATGWNASQTAAAAGFSNASVTRSLAMLTLSPDLQDKIRSGDISASAAYTLACVKDPDERETLSREVIAGRLTRDAVVGQLKSRRRDNRKPSTPAGTNRVTAALGAGRSITICGSGITLESLIQWLEELTAKARKVRPQGIEITTFIKMLRDQAKA